MRIWYRYRYGTSILHACMLNHIFRTCRVTPLPIYIFEILDVIFAETVHLTRPPPLRFPITSSRFPAYNGPVLLTPPQRSSTPSPFPRNLRAAPAARTCFWYVLVTSVPLPPNHCPTAPKSFLKDTPRLTLFPFLPNSLHHLSFLTALSSL